MTFPPNGYLRPSPWVAAQLADYNASSRSPLMPDTPALDLKHVTIGRFREVTAQRDALLARVADLQADNERLTEENADLLRRADAKEAEWSDQCHAIHREDLAAIRDLRERLAATDG